MGAAGRKHLMAALTAAVAALVLVAPAAAQDDPYGSTSTTRPERGPRPSCRLAARSVTAGATTSARVHAVDRGTTVRIYFDGEQVAEAQANGPGTSPKVNVDITYSVPEVEPGSYPVAAVGQAFTASCGNQRVHADAQVAGRLIERGPGSSGGSLPRTGLAIGLLVAVALALILSGRALSRGSRGRGRTARL